MAKKISKRTKKKYQRKILKAIFGKALPIVLILAAIIYFAFNYFYKNNEAFHTFWDGLIGVETTTTTAFNPPYLDPDGGEMAVHFIDVGQGDATLFQTPDGSALVDCGEKEYGETVVEYLKAKGVYELEYFIITHPDSDHMGCAAYVLEHIEVKTFVMNGQEKSAKFFENAIDVLLEKQIDTITAKPGDTITLGALQFSVFGPHRFDFKEAEWNNASLILLATYGHRSFLLTGDAEEEGEADLMEHYGSSIKCDVFSAGHHGSKTSNSKEVLEAARPQYVVISCGKDNSYGHPHQAALDVFASVGATVYRTDELGSIIFVTDGENLEKR
jgi:beta-lactamase superfamily II metal-dependent hydrolase